MKSEARVDGVRKTVTKNQLLMLLFLSYTINLFISFTRVDGEIWREKTEDYQPWQRELILNLFVLVVMVGY